MANDITSAKESIDSPNNMCSGLSVAKVLAKNPSIQSNTTANNNN